MTIMKMQARVQAIKPSVRGSLPVIGLALLALVLSGCAGSPSPVPTQSVSTPQTAATVAPLISPNTPTRPPGCTVQSSQPTSNPTVESLLPPATEKDWRKGPDDALVTILEYSDFQCPGCAGITPILDQLQQKYPQEVRIVYRHFPLSSHDKAPLAAQAAEAAGLQDKFWEMHDLLFEQRDKWVNLSVDQFEIWLVEKTEQLGLDTEKFKADLTSPDLVKLARDAYERNAAIGMPGTPFLLIDNIPYNGPLDFANLDATIALTLLEQRQFSECPPMVIDPTKQYFAVIHTEKGEITLELFADEAPLAVNSFVFLAQQDWFDGVTFHRVLPDFVAQAGDPTGTGFGGPGYAFDNEIDPTLTFDKAGVLAMANAGAGSNGSQFFITYTAVPRLNGGYTIFGQVSSGMDVLKSLTPRNPAESMNLPPGDSILDIEIIEK